jgi:PAS domain S-box-containing protein
MRGKNHSINRQIIFIFSLIFSLLITTTAIHHHNIIKYEQNIHFIRDVSVEQLALLNLIELNAPAKKLAVIYHILSPDSIKKRTYEHVIDSLHRENEKYYILFKDILVREVTKRKLEDVFFSREEFMNQLKKLIAESYQHEYINIIELEQFRLRPAFDSYMKELELLSKIVRSNAELTIENNLQEIDKAKNIGNILLILGLIMLLFITVTIYKLNRRLRGDYQLLEKEIEERKKAQTELQLIYTEMENKVQERTKDLRIAVDDYERANHELFKLNKELSTLYSIIELSDNPIIIRDLNDRITFWNKGAEKLYGYKREEVIQKICHEFLERRFSEPYEKVKKNLLQSGNWCGEVSSRQKDAERNIIVSSNWKIYKDEMDEPLAILEIDHDISDRIEMEERIRNYNKELKEINTAKDKIFSVISHDLRNPIAGLLSSSEFLKNNIDSLGKSEIVKFLNVIHRTSEKLLNQLNELVEWAKSQQHKTFFTPTVLKLCFEVNRAMRILLPTASQKRIRLDNNVPEEIKVKADPFMLRSILQNLITNSIKFTESGGHIMVTAHLKESMVEISIIDTGVGMPPEILDKLFKSENILPATGTNAEPGTGLGLILVKDFVAQHYGIISVESEEGKGTTVKITIPKI